MCFVPKNRNIMVSSCMIGMCFEARSMTIAIGMFYSSCTLAHSIIVIYLWPFLIINSCLLSLVQEWGDPRKEEYYYYMKSYSPVDNVSSDELLFVSL